MCLSTAPAIIRKGGILMRTHTTHSFPTLVLLLAILTMTASAARGQAADESPLLFPVFDEGKTIYIDRSGKVVLNVPYAAGRFSDGLARVTVRGGGAGYIDRTGKLVIGPLAAGARDFA